EVQLLSASFIGGNLFRPKESVRATGRPNLRIYVGGTYPLQRQRKGTSRSPQRNSARYAYCKIHVLTLFYLQNYLTPNYKIDPTTRSTQASRRFYSKDSKAGSNRNTAVTEPVLTG